MVADGSKVLDAGLDHASNAYSATLLGTSISWGGSSFVFGSAGTLNAVSSAIIALPPGNDMIVK